MIKLRWITVVGTGSTMRPPFGSRANAVMPRSISSAFPPPMELTPTATNAPAPLTAPTGPMAVGSATSRSTAARVILGAISLSSSNHLTGIPSSVEVKPVVLPPGRDKLSTIPVPTASGTNTNTIGTVRVACCIALMLGGADVRMTSGVSATMSIAYRPKRAASPAAHRTSMLTLRPTAQPASCKPCRNVNRGGALATPPTPPLNDSTHDAPGRRCTAGFQFGPCPLWVNSDGDDRDDAALHVRFTPKADKLA